MVTDEARLIDASKLRASLEWCEEFLGERVYREAIHLLDRQPTVDPVEHGLWLMRGNECICSRCGLACSSDEYKAEEMSYCLNCGAKMRVFPEKTLEEMRDTDGNR